MKFWMRFLALSLTLATASETLAMELYYSRDVRGFGYLIANGQIGMSDARIINSILANSTKRREPVAIFLTSEGGVLEATPKIAQAISDNSKRLKDLTGVSNVLVINEECDSACSVLTAQLTGQRKKSGLKFIITPSASFGFHSPVQYVDRHVTPITNRSELERSTNKMIKYYLDAGVSSSWINSNSRILHNPNVTSKSAASLCWSDSGVIPFSSCLWFDRDVTNLVERQMLRRAFDSSQNQKR